MTILRVITLSIIASILFSLSATAQDREKTIKRSDLPPAVENAVVAQSQGATIRGFSQERENGKTFYEVELMVSGHSKDVLMDVDGRVVEMEEQISIESLPPAVHEGLQTRAGTGKLIKVETLTKSGKLVAYEAKVLINGKRSEIQVGPDGKPLPQEE